MKDTNPLDGITMEQVEEATEEAFKAFEDTPTTDLLQALIASGGKLAVGNSMWPDGTHYVVFQQLTFIGGTVRCALIRWAHWLDTDNLALIQEDNNVRE